MFSGLPPFFTGAKKNPRGLRLFLAWTAIAIIADGLVTLMVSDVLYMAIAGTTPFTTDDDLEYALLMILIMFGAILGKFGLQAWLILPSLSRAALWIIINCICLLALMGFVQNPSASPHLIVFLSLPFLPLVLLHVRTRSWLSLILVIAFVPIYFLWREVAPFFKDLVDSCLSFYWRPLYVRNVQSLAPISWMLHSIIFGAAVAWLMPPFRPPTPATRPEQPDSTTLRSAETP